jgi:hypothetical protein
MLAPWPPPVCFERRGPFDLPSLGLINLNISRGDDASRSECRLTPTTTAFPESM